MEIEMVSGKPRLRITHINTQDTPGGAAKSTIRLAEMQRREGHQVHVLVGYKKSNMDHYYSFPLGVDRDLQAHCLREGQLYYEFQGSHHLLYHPLVQSADIIHLQNMHGGYFNPYSISALSHFKPVVWTLRDMQAITGLCAHSLDCDRWKTGCGKCPYLSIYPRIPVDKTAQLWQDKKQIYENSHLSIVAISKWMMNKVRASILKEHPAKQIYNLSDSNVFKPYKKNKARRRFGIPDKKFVIGAAADGGALENVWKGGEFTLAAIERLTSKYPEIVFLNIGSSKESDDPRIINIPHLERDEDMAEAYSTLDLFLFTPRAETLSLVVMEAISCGIPVVAFKTGGVPEIFRHAKDGYAVEFQDIENLVQSVELMISDPGLRSKFSTNARIRATTKFNQESIYKEYMDFYARCIEEHPLRSKTLKLFSLDKVPEIVKTPAFLESEIFKSKLINKRMNHMKDHRQSEQKTGSETKIDEGDRSVFKSNDNMIKPSDRFLIVENLFSKPRQMLVEENSDVEELNKQGEGFFEQGNIPEALNAFSMALEMDPKNAMVHNNMGVACYSRGDKEKAFRHYEKAAEIEPDNNNFKKNLADFYHVELGRTKEALEIYLEILKDNPTDVETLLILGHICVSMGKDDEASVFYNKILEFEPWNMDARKRLDDLGKNGKETDDSLIGGFDNWGRDGNQKTGLEGKRGIASPEFMYEQALELIMNGGPGEATGVLKMFLRFYPEHAIAHNDLGVLYFNAGDKEKAQTHYEKAAQFDPDNTTCQKNLADFYYVEQGRIEEALKIYNNILNKNPEDNETLLTMGHICISLEQYDSSKTFYKRVMEIDPENPDAGQGLERARNLGGNTD